MMCMGVETLLKGRRSSGTRQALRGGAAFSADASALILMSAEAWRVPPVCEAAPRSPGHAGPAESVDVLTALKGAL